MNSLRITGDVQDNCLTYGKGDEQVIVGKMQGSIYRSLVNPSISSRHCFEHPICIHIYIHLEEGKII